MFAKTGSWVINPYKFDFKRCRVKLPVVIWCELYILGSFMKKLMSLALCGAMGFYGIVGAQGTVSPSTMMSVENIDKALSSLSVKQKDALRKIANKYAMVAGQENGLKQEVLEQFKKEVAKICVADDDTDLDLEEDGNKGGNKIVWYIIGGAALLVGGFIIYKIFFSKSSKDKVMDAIREGLPKLGQVERGEMTPEAFVSWMQKQPFSEFTKINPTDMSVEDGKLALEFMRRLIPLGVKEFLREFGAAGSGFPV